MYDLERRRDASDFSKPDQWKAKAKPGQLVPWRDNPREMYLKSAIRATERFWVLAPNAWGAAMRHALHIDNADDLREQRSVPPEAGPVPKPEAQKQRARFADAIDLEPDENAFEDPNL
jgi:recombinational DNA repair protein RecT